jgi:multidrug efflux pump subunit AcrA (membrane-fusion protein)
MDWKALVCVGLLGLGCKRVVPVEARVTPEAKAAENKAVPAPVAKRGQVRATGTIQAVRAYSVQVPRIEGQVQAGPGGGRMTLVKLAPNGTKVQEGDLLAEFDSTAQLDAAREAQAKYEDLSHQVRQKAAQNKSDQEKRAAELKEAEAELAKARIQLKKGPVLSEIDRLKNEERGRSAEARVASLKKIDDQRRRAEAASLRILELQMERQKVALERAKRNAEKLVLKAPIAGMVALQSIWRGGSMGNAQEGDQLFPGQQLLKIFDPSEMYVQALVGEPEGAVLRPGARALVQLDAYPDAVFPAQFQAASPVATTALGSPIKNFTAQFKLEQTDPRLLPDLSAAVVIRAEEGQ